VHVQYSYDDNSVAVVNGMNLELKERKVSAKNLQYRWHGKSFQGCHGGFAR